MKAALPRRTPRQYLLRRNLRDRRALGRDERGRARRDEAVGRRLAEGHGALVRRDVGVDRAGLDELEVLLFRAFPSQQRAEPACTSSARWSSRNLNATPRKRGARHADKAPLVQRLFQAERRDLGRGRHETVCLRGDQRGAK